MTLLLLLAGASTEQAPIPITQIGAIVVSKDASTIIQSPDDNPIVKTPDDSKQVIMGGTIES